MSIFFSAAILAGAFGGLFTRAISNLSGKGGKPGWVWIFIIEGLVTIFVAGFAKFLIHDNPKTYVGFCLDFPHIFNSTVPGF
jgi:MFS family permease